MDTHAAPEDVFSAIVEASSVAEEYSKAVFEIGTKMV